MIELDASFRFASFRVHILGEGMMPEKWSKKRVRQYDKVRKGSDWPTRDQLYNEAK